MTVTEQNTGNQYREFEKIMEHKLILWYFDPLPKKTKVKKLFVCVKL